MEPHRIGFLVGVAGLALAVGNEPPTAARASNRDSKESTGEAVGRTVLGLRDPRFTINGRPMFLLGISYYGALGAPDDFLRRDLDEMQRDGFVWLRVFATWGAFDQDLSA